MPPRLHIVKVDVTVTKSFPNGIGVQTYVKIYICDRQIFCIRPISRQTITGACQLIRKTDTYQAELFQTTEFRIEQAD